MDNPENIKSNFILIWKARHDPNSMVMSDQVHKTIFVCNFEDRGKGYVIPRDYDEIDGLTTNTTGLIGDKICGLCAVILCGYLNKTTVYPIQVKRNNSHRQKQ